MRYNEPIGFAVAFFAHSLLVGTILSVSRGLEIVVPADASTRAPVPHPSQLVSLSY